MIRRRGVLLLEFLILCIALPGYIILSRSAPFMFTFLWSATLYCFVIYRMFYFQGWGDFWKWNTVTWANMKLILIRWIVACIGMAAFLYFYEPGNMFQLVRERPDLIPWILLVYPVISALPQEFIFCTYFFKRYESFFGSGKAMVFVSAVVFAYVHVLYINPVAPLFSFLGGLVFALTFLKHKSLALVTIEHALYGGALFLIGLGSYFYSGNVSG